MLIIAISILLLAVTSNMEYNYNYLADYVKFNRIVLIIFILGAYIAYNTLYVEDLINGIGIYGGVFKITILSQVFDIVLFLIGGLVCILTCFIPYELKNYSDAGKELSLYSDNVVKENSKDTNPLILGNVNNNINIGNNNPYNLFFISDFKDYINNKLIKIYPRINYGNLSLLSRIFINLLKKISELLPKLSINTPYILDKKINYKKLEIKEYSFLLLFTVLGGSLLISSQNLISLYLSLELQSFTLYILSTSQIRSFKGTSGGLKYFLLGGLSSGFILLGCSLIYAYTGTLNLEHIFMLYSEESSHYFIDPCLLVLFAGLLFKISAAPFHNWAPDVYSDVPTYSTTWLIIIAKLSVLIFMLLLLHNVYSGLNLNNLGIMEQFDISSYSSLPSIYDNSLSNSMNILYDVDSNTYSTCSREDILFSFQNPSYSSLGIWTNVLTLSAIFSLIIGTVLGLSQSRVKRLFAYSTIAHVGFLLLALSLNSVASIDAFIFYLIQYTLTNLNLFFILIAWGYLYCLYYLEKDFLSVRYLSISPLSWKDIYIEPNISDFFDSVKEKYGEFDKNLKINTLFTSHLMNSEVINYDFDSENNEWLYTPVPFLTNFKGMHSTDPFLAFCLAVTLFSLAGIPPLIGFFAKQQVLLASMQLDYYFVSVVAILTSVISAAYYLRIVKFIYFYDHVFVPYYLSIDEYNNKRKDFNNNNNLLESGSLFIFNSINGWKSELTGETYMNNRKEVLVSNNLSIFIAIFTNITLFYILKPYVLINIIYIITIPLFGLNIS